MIFDFLVTKISRCNISRHQKSIIPVQREYATCVASLTRPMLSCIPRRLDTYKYPIEAPASDETHALRPAEACATQMVRLGDSVPQHSPRMKAAIARQ